MRRGYPRPSTSFSTTPTGTPRRATGDHPRFVVAGRLPAIKSNARPAFCGSSPSSEDR
jgi:hypothetical protein